MEYIFVVEIKNQKLAIKNKKYIKNSKTSKLIIWKYKREFNTYPDLLSLQGYKIYHVFKTEKIKGNIPAKIISDYQNSFCQDIPLWVLEYKEIWNLVKDNLYVQYLPNSKPVKVNQEKLEFYLPKLQINSKSSNIEGKIKRIYIKLTTSAVKLKEELNSKKNISINFISYLYQNFDYIYGSFGLGVYGTNYLINEKYKKILKTDSKIKNFDKYFNLTDNSNRHNDTTYSVSAPRSISFENLLKLFKKFKDELIVYYGEGKDKTLRYVDSKKLIESLNNYSQAFLEKIINTIQQNNYFFEYNQDIYIIDEELFDKIEIIFERFFSKDLKEFLNKIKIGENFKKKNENIIKKLESLNDFKAQLYPHQEIAVSWLYNLYEKNIPGALLADTMGLGKSLSTIGTLALIQNKKPNTKITIICPASMVGTWDSEIQKFYPNLKNYKIFSYEKALRSAENTDILVLDEAQKIKNNRAETYKAISAIKKKFTIILTGTPIENKIDDIINILGVIDPVFLKLKPLKKYSNNFILKLKEVINPIYLQRKKSDVNIEELSTKLEEKPIFINPSELELKLINEIRKIYHNKLIQLQAENNYEFYESQILLTGLMRIRQAISYPNQLPQELRNHLSRNMQIAINNIIPSKFKKLENLCKEKVNKKEKIVIFAEFTETIKFLKSELSKNFKVITLTGSDSSQRRKVIIDTFQEGLYDIIIISLKAGNSGITLHTANNVIIYDLWFNPQVLAQAIARVHRIGQSKDVEADLLVLKNTFDQRIYDILYIKKKLIENFENYNPNKIAKEIADDYFKNFKKDF